MLDHVEFLHDYIAELAELDGRAEHERIAEGGRS